MAEAKDKKEDVPKKVDKPLTKEEETWPTSVKEYEVFGRIGKGAFASVYMARCLANNQNVAIKVIELEDQDETKQKEQGLSWDAIQKEVSIMNTIEHPNVMCCFAAFCVSHELWLVIPILLGSMGDMMHKIAKYKNGFADELIICTILRDALSGIECIHECGFVHRDIKAGNILMSASGKCLLSDFGVSGSIIENGLRRTQMNTFTGSLYWISPEMVDSKQSYSYKTDIWSLGITALELAYAKVPHSGIAPAKVTLVVQEGPAPTLQSMADNLKVNHKYSNKFKDFLSKCLQKEPQKRSSAKQLLKNSFIKQAKDEQYLINTVVSFASELKLSEKAVNKNILPESIQMDHILQIEKQSSLSFSYSISRTFSEFEPDKIVDRTNTKESLSPTPTPTAASTSLSPKTETIQEEANQDKQ
eukprot:70888_1